VCVGVCLCVSVYVWLYRWSQEEIRFSSMWETTWVSRYVHEETYVCQKRPIKETYTHTHLLRVNAGDYVSVVFYRGKETYICYN